MQDPEEDVYWTQNPGPPSRDADSGGMGVDPGDQAVLGLHCKGQASLCGVLAQ